jgi:hypothetical protein
MSVEDIRKQVETEQALSDALKRVEQLELEIKQVTEEKTALAAEKDGQSESLLFPRSRTHRLTADSTSSQLRTQLSALQSTYHQNTSEMAVLQARLAVSLRRALTRRKSR